MTVHNEGASSGAPALDLTPIDVELLALAAFRAESAYLAAVEANATLHGLRENWRVAVRQLREAQRGLPERGRA
jgi:hypothetical protein